MLFPSVEALVPQPKPKATTRAGNVIRKKLCRVYTHVSGDLNFILELKKKYKLNKSVPIL